MIKLLCNTFKLCHSNFCCIKEGHGCCQGIQMQRRRHISVYMFVYKRNKRERTVVCEPRFAETHEQVLLYLIRRHKLGADRTVEACEEGGENKQQHKNKNMRTQMCQCLAHNSFLLICKQQRAWDSLRGFNPARSDVTSRPHAFLSAVNTLSQSDHRVVSAPSQWRLRVNKVAY